MLNRKPEEKVGGAVRKNTHGSERKRMDTEAILSIHRKNLQAKTAAMSEPEKFRAYALQMLDAEYAWGKENVFGSDCSGTVCLPLMLLGYSIRTTADTLYRKVFTESVAEKDRNDASKIMAVFYLTNTPMQRRGTELPKDYGRHVTPVVGEWVVLEANAEKGRVVLRTSRAVTMFYKRMNCRAVWRAFSPDRARQVSAAGSELWGVDPELTRVEPIDEPGSGT